MKSVVWDVTSKCNLRCIHCYNYDKYFKHDNKDLSIDEIYSLLGFLKENNVKQIHLLGGEPLIHPNILEILWNLKEIGIRTSITTNATLLNNVLSSEICKKDLIDNIIVSIDGGTDKINDSIRGKGVFGKTIHNLIEFNDIQKIYKSNVKMTVSHCIMPFNNMDENLKIIDVCKEINACGLSISPAINSGNANQNFKEYHDSLSVICSQVNGLISYAESKYPELDIQLEMRPLVSQYFNYKYKNRVICPSGHALCLAYSKELYYLKADGTFLPCGLVEFPVGLYEQSLKHFDISDAYTFNEKIKNFSEIDNSKLFLDFFNSYNTYLNYKRSNICFGCDHYELCQPCPFQNRNNEIIDDCNVIYLDYVKIRNESKDWIITKIFDVPLKNELLSSILGKIKIKQTIWELYNNYGFNDKMNYDYFFNEIKELEHRYIIEIERK